MQEVVARKINAESRISLVKKRGTWEVRMEDLSLPITIRDIRLMERLLYVEFRKFDLTRRLKDKTGRDLKIRQEGSILAPVKT